MAFLFFVISLFASTIGAISGIGGGIIIKPVLDATNTMSIGTIGFLSGCTVLSMASVTLLRSRKTGIRIDKKISTFLAAGGAIGGLTGKALFDASKRLIADEKTIGAAQAAILFLLTLGILLYIRQKSRIQTRHISNPAYCSVIGLFLGLLSAFLGIGGGPVNVIVLQYFFSMDSKTTSRNSIYIIVFSQMASLASTLVSGSVPPFDPPILGCMIAAGILGGTTGSMIFNKVNAKTVDVIFILVLCLILLINVWNFIAFISI